MGVSPVLLTVLIALSAFFSETESSTSLGIVNNCNYTIWPALKSRSSSPGSASLPTTGFTLKSGDSFNLSVPTSWQGSVWGRTLCNVSSTGNFSCFTADCGTGKTECNGNSLTPPATSAEFGLDQFDGLDFYDVTLVDGFNLPMAVEPLGGKNCSSSGCSADLNGECPKELRVAREGSQGTVACMTPCTAFKNDLFCCSGNYTTPETCAGTVYTDYSNKDARELIPSRLMIATRLRIHVPQLTTALFSALSGVKSDIYLVQCKSPPHTLTGPIHF